MTTDTAAPAAEDGSCEAATLLKRCLPIIQQDAQMMADISRHAPLDAESQAMHDSTEYESEKLVREISAFLARHAVAELAKKQENDRA